MQQPNANYTVGWDEHAKNIATNFTQLLNEKQLVDVTLVADGHMYNAHRLVLSAISPNFRKMFTQMPANQQAYVIMKDVSRQTMEDLIAYIYTGEVTVKPEELTNLLEAAKSLDINGLTAEQHSASFGQKQRFNQFTSKSKMEYPSTSNGHQSKRNIFEYRSTQTNPINKKSSNTSVKNDILIEPKEEQSELLNEENFDIVEFSLADGPTNQNDSNNSDETNFDKELLEFLMNTDETLMNGLSDGQGNDDNAVGFKPIATEDVDGPRRKRAKRKFEKSDYHLVADIRKETNGIEHLYHENFLFRKNGKCAQNNTQRWACSKKDAISCKATASTVEIDGVRMMKLMTAEHCHQP